MVNDEKKELSATFAGGCFWCMVQPFESILGVLEVVVGYAGGTGQNPTYQDFAQKGYKEAVQVTYDPQNVDYQKLLEVFWKNIDPTDSGGQFYDRGTHYTTAIYYHNQEQLKEAEKSKEDLQASGLFSKKIATAIIPFSTFYPAEQYHQQYYKKQPERYTSYKTASGREQFLHHIWGTQDCKIDGLRQTLTPLQYDVIRCNGTEPPFANEYWDNKAEGIYVDRVSGEPLFSSLDKYDSGTGWPSFTKPLEPENIREKEDRKLERPRTEVRSKQADSHLGHVFCDGPKPTCMRYCINSAAIRFIPLNDLEKEGYGKYKALFEKKKK